jgi:phage terminase large subunit
LSEAEVPGGWEPRRYQRSLWRYLEGGGKRADVVAHRRWGKDEVALNWAAIRAVRRPGAYWHLLPEASQGRKAIWDAVNPHTGRRRIDEAFPPEIRERTRDSEMIIHFKSGATWQVVGSDNFNSLMGSPPLGVVFSEWSLAKPDAWSFIRPILAENGGWALFLWTPRGRNHATRAFEARSRDPAWFTLKSPATATDVFTPEQLARERAELIAELGSEEEGSARFASEYLVDFDAAAPGAYYAGLLGAAERDGRIGRVPYDPALKVDTAWDLGIDDYTAIWFLQQAGREVRAIDYFETSGEGLQQVVRAAIAAKPCVFGTHHLPHDVMVRELGAAGRSRLETLGSLGIGSVSVGAAMDPEERINAARLMIPITWFDAERCAVGLERLRGYRKRWSRATRSYLGPLHDESSHGADAFGEFAVNRRARAGDADGNGRRACRLWAKPHPNERSPDHGRHARTRRQGAEQPDRDHPRQRGGLQGGRGEHSRCEPEDHVFRALAPAARPDPAAAGRGAHLRRQTGG